MMYSTPRKLLTTKTGVQGGKHLIGQYADVRYQGDDYVGCKILELSGKRHKSTYLLRTKENKYIRVRFNDMDNIKKE